MSKIHQYSMRYQEKMAIDRFLHRLAADLDRGRHVRGLPDELARAMLDNLSHVDDWYENIQGEVAL